MTIDQLRDRFDRPTDGGLPTPDLADAIAGGRRRRRASLISYVAGSSAVAVVAVAVVAPHLAAGADRAGDRAPAASSAVSTDSSFVPGTDIDERLAAAVATAMPMRRRRRTSSRWTGGAGQRARVDGAGGGPAAPGRAVRRGDGVAAALRRRSRPHRPDHGRHARGRPVAEQRMHCGRAAVPGPTRRLGSPRHGFPRALYMDGQDEPSSPAFLMQSSGEEPSGQDAVMLAFTERVEDGTEAEGRERALFKGYPGLELINALDLAGALQPHE